MSGIILYKSEYGATKRYAEWLSESTGFSCIKTNKAEIGVISGYDVVILGGGIYASLLFVYYLCRSVFYCHIDSQGGYIPRMVFQEEAKLNYKGKKQW